MSFQGVGGTGPYGYFISQSGAGGSINSTTGIYTPPGRASSDPKNRYDTIIVRDSLGASATSTILVGTPVLLLCDILQTELALSQGRVYLWDQKIMQPTDSDLYIAVSVMSFHPFASVNRPSPNGGGLDQQQSLNVLATISLDVISRSTAALDRKEEVVLALNSVYSQQQQAANSFYISRLSNGTKFVNLSEVDGAAIPYRFNMTFSLQYGFVKTKAAPFFDDFSREEIVNN